MIARRRLLLWVGARTRILLGRGRRRAGKVGTLEGFAFGPSSLIQATLLIVLWRLAIRLGRLRMVGCSSTRRSSRWLGLSLPCERGRTSAGLWCSRCEALRRVDLLLCLMWLVLLWLLLLLLRENNGR